jgi:molybdenum cofactor cytidylyltransferase
MSARPAIIVLAAGKGSRFQGIHHKLAQPLGRISMLEATLANAVATGLSLLVVTTAALVDLVTPQAQRGEVLLLPEAGSMASQGLGMGYSIAAGVAARSEASGWLILPADMPLMQPRTLLAVADALEENTIAYAQYNGMRGHPVGFGAELYSELVRLTGDEDARRLLARYPGQAVAVDDPGVLLDIDTVEDLERARNTMAVSPFGLLR